MDTIRTSVDEAVREGNLSLEQILEYAHFHLMDILDCCASDEVEARKGAREDVGGAYTVDALNAEFADEWLWQARVKLNILREEVR